MALMRTRLEKQGSDDEDDGDDGEDGDDEDDGVDEDDGGDEKHRDVIFLVWSLSTLVCDSLSNWLTPV